LPTCAAGVKAPCRLVFTSRSFSGEFELTVNDAQTFVNSKHIKAVAATAVSKAFDIDQSAVTINGIPLLWPPDHIPKPSIDYALNFPGHSGVTAQDIQDRADKLKTALNFALMDARVNVTVTQVDIGTPKLHAPR
jgi:hypothetical protein